MSSSNANLGLGSLTLKYLVFLFNLIFFVCGLVLIVIGGVAQGFFKEYVKFFDNEFKTPAMGLIILGAIILIVSFFGCCGARMENVCMLRTFSFLLVVLLICEIAAGISIAVLKSDIEEVITDKMNRTMQEYNNVTLAKDAWDKMQANLHCCGTHNYTDWGATLWSEGTNVPDSCCKKIFKDCGKDALTDPNVAKHINQDGCTESLKDSALRNLGAIIGAAAGLAIIQVIGIWMSCCLVRAVKDHYEVL